MHKPADMSLWTGRIDAEEPVELSYRLHQLIQPTLNQKSAAALDNETAPVLAQRNALALIGFCSDEGVRRNQGRVGARNGPDRLRRTLANLPWPSDIPVTDAGNVICQDNDLEQAQQELAGQVSRQLSAGRLPFVLGGGHEVAYGSWLGLADYYYLTNGQTNAQPPRIGIINFDAHFDLRLDSAGASSGTPFYQIAQQCEQRGLAFNYCCLGVSEMANTQALFQRADNLGVSYRRDTGMAIDQLSESLQQLQRFIDACDVIYLSIDLDVLPASVAPGVSAPAPRGVGLEVLEPLIQRICDSGKLKLADIAEYNPEFDIDNWTARVATRLFYLIANGALNR
ncbi:MAG: formiminoglutamase [Motiliproteus sp.]|jgi:formiminoglutamase